MRRFSLPVPKSFPFFLLQLCGVRGGGEAASQAMFWRPRNDLSLVVAFESTRERNTAIMLARRFAIDCNVCGFTKHYVRVSCRCNIFSYLIEMVADHPCWARRQNSLVKERWHLCSADPTTLNDPRLVQWCTFWVHSVFAPVPLISLFSLGCSALPRVRRFWKKAPCAPF